MARSHLCYRGVRYDTSAHESPSAVPVEHVYRGLHYRESLRHQPQPVDPSIEYHYRGTVYHHDATPAAVDAGPR